MAVNYDELQNNPQVRQFLDLIAHSEGTYGKGDNGYNVAFGGGLFSDLSKHPNIKHSFTNLNGEDQTTTAAGRYQILFPTAKALAKQLGTKDFSPATQDKMAIALINQHGALNDVLSGDYESAINKLGSTWASLPSSPYAQPKQSMNSLLDFAQGRSHLPASVIDMQGRPMIAVPSNSDEHDIMQSIYNNPSYSPETQAMLTNALGQITHAQNQLADSSSLFDTLPSELDIPLLDLIDKA